MSADPAPSETKTCARCGARFGCGAAEGACWCGKVTLPPAAAAALRAEHDDCLCPGCLAAIADAPEERTRR
jgi:hypothetical protein